MFGISTRKLACELIGTAGLTTAAILTSGTEEQPFAIAGFLICLQFAFGPISGAHLNPAVSLGVFGFGLSEMKANPLDFPLYTLCQFIGAILGGFISAGIIGNQGSSIQSFPQMEATSLPTSFAIEMFACYFFVLAVLRCSHSATNSKSQATGLVIGLIYFIGLLMCLKSTGGYMNPAVSSGVWIYNVVRGYISVGSVGDHFVAYHAGPIIGALTAIGTHVFLENELCIWTQDNDDDIEENRFEESDDE